MNALVMSLLLLVAFGVFALAAGRRWLLLRTGRAADRFDRLGDRVKAVWRYAFIQERMDYYQPAGIAHKLIFVGFVVLLLRTLVLWGRGFDASFNLWVLAPWMPLGKLYEFMKDTVGLMVIIGVSIFFYYRVIRPMKRTTLSKEGLLILGIIFTMMVADMVYDGAAYVIAHNDTLLCGITGHESVSAARGRVLPARLEQFAAFRVVTGHEVAREVEHQRTRKGQ